MREVILNLPINSFFDQIVLMTSFFYGLKAHACSCARGDLWLSQLIDRENTVIFEGIALSTNRSAQSLELQEALTGPLNPEYAMEVLQSHWNKYEHYNSYVTEFSVLKVYKGDVSDRIIVTHNVQGSACGVTPSLTENNMVVAYKNENGDFSTSSCALYRAPEETIRKYFETGKDIFLPSRHACYSDIKKAYEETKSISEIKLQNPDCVIYQKDILAFLKR